MTHRNSSTYYSSCPTKRSYIATDSSRFHTFPSPVEDESPPAVINWTHKDDHLDSVSYCSKSYVHSNLPPSIIGTLTRIRSPSSSVCGTLSRARPPSSTHGSLRTKYVVAIPRSNCGSIRRGSGSRYVADIITSDEDTDDRSRRLLSSKRSLQRSISHHSAYPE